MESPLLPPGVAFVRLLWCDTGNLVRAKVFPATRISSVMSGVGLTCAVMGFPPLYDAVFSGSPVGEVRFVPDRGPFRRLPYTSTHAVAFGNLFNWGDGTPFPCDPRAFVQRAVDALAEHDLQLKIGFENEFVLMRDDGEPIDQTVWADSRALMHDRVTRLLDEIVESLEALGIGVEQYHAESANGQFEVVTTYTDPLAAADNLVLTRVTIGTLAIKYGYKATFVPKPFAMQAGSASHAHMSLWRHGVNIFPDITDKHTGISTTAQAFLAGVLDRLPALLAVTTPSMNSFERIVPQCWSGAFTVWGVENREAPLRVVNDRSNFELKAFDATANPYIAIGAIMFAGLHGVATAMSLPPATQVDPSTLSADAGERGGVKRLPTTLGDALDRFEADDVLRAAMGPQMHANYVAVHRKQFEVMVKMSKDEAMKVMQNRF